MLVLQESCIYQTYKLDFISLEEVIYFLPLFSVLSISHEKDLDSDYLLIGFNLKLSEYPNMQIGDLIELNCGIFGSIFDIEIHSIYKKITCGFFLKDIKLLERIND